MRTITKYKADDGREFPTEAECAKYEALCAEIATVLSVLPPKPKDDGCAFSNGEGYIQHDPATFAATRLSLLRIADRICPFRWISESIADPTIDPSWAGRIIGEHGGPLATAWYRIECTDKNLREWGQPYYAHHPGGTEKRLNA